MAQGRAIAELYDDLEESQAKFRRATNDSAFLKEELGDLQFMMMQEQVLAPEPIEDSPVPVKRKIEPDYSTLSYNDVRSARRAQIGSVTISKVEPLFASRNQSVGEPGVRGGQAALEG